MAQVKIQAYMERHKLGPLFEDLMSRVLRDMPEEPLIYLLRTLYKKVGMEIPQDIRYGGLRKSVSEATRSHSPERTSKSRSGKLASSSDGAAAIAREYGKPWLTNPRPLNKPRHSSDEPELSKTGKRKKPDWQSDTRVKATSFDDLWEGNETVKKKDSATVQDKQHQPSSDVYNNGDYRGPHHQFEKMTEEELLAAESLPKTARELKKSQDLNVSQGFVQSTSGVLGHGAKGQRWKAEEHKKQLESVLHSSVTEQKNIPPVTFPEDDGPEDDAIELLENADDLLNEGVKTVSASGFKLSKIMRERSNEPCVKLNINLSPRAVGPSALGSMQSMEGYESDQENTSPVQGESEEEFESVSQVTGPRQPVWQILDSDGESMFPGATQHSRDKHSQKGRHLQSTAPVELVQELTSTLKTYRPVDMAPSHSWSPGMNAGKEKGSSPELDEDVGSGALSARPRGYGWAVPDDSDAASSHDWNARVKGKNRDPRAY